MRFPSGGGACLRAVSPRTHPYTGVNVPIMLAQLESQHHHQYRLAFTTGAATEITSGARIFRMNPEVGAAITKGDAGARSTSGFKGPHNGCL